jgi:hypothetical protein
MTVTLTMTMPPSIPEDRMEKWRQIPAIKAYYERECNEVCFQNVHSIKTRANFQFGDCASFAVALHRVFGLKIYMIGECHHLIGVDKYQQVWDSLGKWPFRMDLKNNHLWMPPHVYYPSLCNQIKRIEEEVALRFVWDKSANPEASSGAYHEAVQIIQNVPVYQELGEIA